MPCQTGSMHKYRPKEQGTPNRSCLNQDPWAGSKLNFCLLDAAEKYIAQPHGCFVVKTEVRILFHHIKCVAEFVSKFRLRCADRHDFILAGGSIAFLRPFFPQRGRFHLSSPHPRDFIVFSSLRKNTEAKSPNLVFLWIFGMSC